MDLQVCLFYEWLMSPGRVALYFILHINYVACTVAGVTTYQHNFMCFKAKYIRTTVAQSMCLQKRNHFK